MTDAEQLITISQQLAAAIARRDTAAVRAFLAEGFVQRHAGGGDPADADAFVAAIGKILGEIRSVRVDQLTTDVRGDGAIVTGVQHAQLMIDGELVDDRRAFVDWFVREGGDWRLRAAIDVE